MRFVRQHADQVLGAVVQEDAVVPRVFFKSTRIDRPQSSGRVDAEFVRAQPDDWTMLLMEGIDRADLHALASLPPDPYRQDRGGEMGVWDLRQG